jgi:DNA-binding response OmpR family regulator
MFYFGHYIGKRGARRAGTGDFRRMPNRRTILIVDDDTELREALVEQLALHEEFEVTSVDSGTKAVQAAKGGQLDLVIMDVGLPDVDGREAVRILRKNGFKSPIIMLTGHDTDSDTILGLESGANDYVTKPFRFAVLLARIRAQLRQHEASEDAVFTIGPYSFRPSSKLLLSPKGSKVRLTEKETAILRYLYRRAETGVARDFAAGSVGLQFRRHHAYAGDAHLPSAAEGGKGRRHAVDPGDRSRRLQAGAVRNYPVIPGRAPSAEGRRRASPESRNKNDAFVVVLDSGFTRKRACPGMTMKV